MKTYEYDGYEYEWRSYDGTSAQHVLLKNEKLGASIVGMVIRTSWGWIACDHATVDGHYKDEQAAKKAVEVLVGLKKED